MLLAIKFPVWLSPEIIPGLPFRWYGLMYLVAFGIAYIFFNKQIKERHFPMTDDQLSGLFFWGILGLLLGARIFATIVYETSDIYRLQPWLVFWPFRSGHFTGLQGMSYHGGVIGCITGFTLWSIVHKFDVREIGDMLSAAVPLGYTFGRIGNFINGELYGRITTSSIGVIFPNAERFDPKIDWVREAAEKTGIAIPQSANGVSPFVNLPRHPSQLYEAFFEGVFLWLIIWALRKNKPFKGFLFALYIGGYGLFRFFIEYFREPDSDLGYIIQLFPNNSSLSLTHPLTSFSTGQLLCGLMILLAIAGGIIAKKLPESGVTYFYKKEMLNAKKEKTEEEKIESKKKLRKLRNKLK
ncbi:prolipoprotein diacylglyceryl transferase [Spirochaetia bacterium]|nr:prolipoprotein diacylglyceryl transferase [Spirochaetia bacterium]